MSIALAVIGSLFAAAGLLGARRIPRHKATALTATGAAFHLAYNTVTGHQYWAGVFTVTLILLAGATVSYYREARKPGGAR